MYQLEYEFINYHKIYFQQYTILWNKTFKQRWITHEETVLSIFTYIVFHWITFPNHTNLICE